MSKGRLAVLCVLVMGIGLPTLAAPLNPLAPRIDVTVGGHANVAGLFPTTPPTSYSLSGHAENFTESGMQLSGNVRTGQTPGVLHTAGAGSSAGIRFDQIGVNEYVLELSSTAVGDVQNRDPLTFGTGHMDSEGRVMLTCDFQVLGLPGQMPGSPSTILLSLEHTGSLHTLNMARATSEAQLHVDALSDFDYNDTLATPSLPLLPFDGVEFTGSRARALSGAVMTSVGSTFRLTAMLHSSALGDLSSSGPAQSVGAESLFASGLRLHMTVMPEPATALFLAVGGLLLRRRRPA